MIAVRNTEILLLKSVKKQLVLICQIRCMTTCWLFYAFDEHLWSQKNSFITSSKKVQKSYKFFDNQIYQRNRAKNCLIKKKGKTFDVTVFCTTSLYIIVPQIFLKTAFLSDFFGLFKNTK